MPDLAAFKRRLRAVVSGLARALLAGVPTTDTSGSFRKQHPEAEDQLGVLVDSLCEDAVEEILKMVQSAAVKQDETQPLFDRSRGDAMIPQMTDGENESGSIDMPGEVSSPPLQVMHPDHEYTKTFSLPSSTTTTGQDGDSGKRKLNSSMSINTTFKCSHCRMLFPNTERLTDHEKKSHSACSVCGVPFTGILKLREHQMTEHRLLPYTCDYCPKRFNHKAHRDLHVKARHTGEKSCHCDICGKGYSGISVLKTHRLTHFQKTFICDVCGKSFYHGCHLTRHKLVHQEVRPYRCSSCGKGFTQAENLRSHQLIHTGEKQLCSICGNHYRCLKSHVIRKHSHELPATELPAHNAITCDVCQKNFTNLSQYKLHQQRHTGEKPFGCDVCGKSYRWKELLRDHRYTHSGEKPYSCSLCSKTFSLATSFARHRSIHSDQKPYSCHTCSKHFRLLSFLKAHLQTKAHLKQTQQSSLTSDSSGGGGHSGCIRNVQGSGGSDEVHSRREANLPLVAR
ncbi:uncharacterized protein ACBR49_009240 [Aulostomus maculatus]